jgi:hypothetical protein
LSNRINAKGSGTVTSIATTNATGITGGTITTTGTLAIDTTLISTRLWRQKGIDSVNTQVALKANIASPTFTGTVTIPTGANITTPNILGLTSGTTNDSIVVADATSGALKRISSTRIGSGISGLTTNYVPKATSATAIGNSQIFDNGTSVGINTATPSSSFKLDVNGRGRFRDNLLINSTVDYGWALQVNDISAFRVLNDGTFGRHQGLNFNTVNWNLSGVNSQVMVGTAGSAYENQLVIVSQNGAVRINPYGTNYTNRPVIIGNTTARTEKLQVDGTSFFSGTSLFGTGTANASALLEVNSTTQGLGLPRMTTTQINAIASPAAGLTVYNTTLALICFFNGTAWQKVTATAM